MAAKRKTCALIGFALAVALITPRAAIAGLADPRMQLGANTALETHAAPIADRAQEIAVDVDAAAEQARAEAAHGLHAIAPSDAHLSPKTRVMGSDVPSEIHIWAETPLTLRTHWGFGYVYGEIASGYVLGAGGAAFGGGPGGVGGGVFQQGAGVYSGGGYTGFESGGGYTGVNSALLFNDPFIESSFFQADFVAPIGAIRSVTTAGAYSAASLFRNAIGRYGEGPLTAAGRALTKHPDALNLTKATLRDVFNTSGAINRAASDLLKNILRNGYGSSSVTGRFGAVVEYQLPFGYGARWSAESGEFIGFISPVQ